MTSTPIAQRAYEAAVDQQDHVAREACLRAMPSLSEAKRIRAQWSNAQIQDIAKRGFDDPASISKEERLAILADRRLHFAEQAS
jgi:hypothetical protein